MTSLLPCRVDRADLLRAPVREPQPAIVPARRFANRQPTQQDPWFSHRRHRNPPARRCVHSLYKWPRARSTASFVRAGWRTIRWPTRDIVGLAVKSGLPAERRALSFDVRSAGRRVGHRPAHRVACRRAARLVPLPVRPCLRGVRLHQHPDARRPALSLTGGHPVGLVAHAASPVVAVPAGVLRAAGERRACGTGCQPGTRPSATSPMCSNRWSARGCSAA